MIFSKTLAVAPRSCVPALASHDGNFVVDSRMSSKSKDASTLRPAVLVRANCSSTVALLRVEKYIDASTEPDEPGPT